MTRMRGVLVTPSMALAEATADAIQCAFDAADRQEILRRRSKTIRQSW